MPENAMDETFEPVSLFGMPALFTNLRLYRSTVPEGLYAYDIRHGDNEVETAAAIENLVSVNHMGTVITAERLDLQQDGYIGMSEENGGLNFNTSHNCTTVAAYMESVRNLPFGRAVFVRKAANAGELPCRSSHIEEKDLFYVQKSVALSPAMYDIFKEHLLFDWGFTRENPRLLFGEGAWDCMLVCTEGRADGICVTTEGHDYARYAAYIADRTALNLGTVPAERYPPERERGDVQRLVSQWREYFSVTHTQKLLCGIGEILENEGGEQDQYYLFNHRLGGFAGFCGEATGVTDQGGEALCVGDMIRPGSNMNNSSLVFLHSDGAPFPPTDYVKEAKVTRLAGWQDSILFMRSRDFEVFSCRDDYRMSRQLAPHRRADTRERRQGGR